MIRFFICVYSTYYKIIINSKWTTATKKFCHKLWLNSDAEKAGISLIPMFKATHSDEPLNVPELFKSTIACARLSSEQLKHLNKSVHQNYR